MLDLSPILLLSSGLVFLLVLARLNSCLYKPLFKHMDERDAQIESDMQSARDNGADVDGMLEEAKQIIAQAKKEALAIREKAKTEALETSDKKLAEAKSQIEQKYAQFENELANEKNSLKETLASQIPQYKDSLNSKLSTI